MNIYQKKIWDQISCCNLPIGGPVHMNQHQSWLMRNEKQFWPSLAQIWPNFGPFDSFCY